MPDQTNQVPPSTLKAGELFLLEGVAWVCVHPRDKDGVRLPWVGCISLMNGKPDGLNPDTLVTPLKLVPASAEVCPKGTMDALRKMTNWASCLDEELMGERQVVESVADIATAESILQQADAMKG